MEYLRAIAMTKERTTKLQYRMLWAMTYFRANQQDEARKAYGELATLAHKEDLAVDEAECHRAMALFNPDAAAALKDLDAAQAVLSQKHELPRAEREAELATILQTRAFIAARAGMADVAAQALEQLTPFAEKSRSNVIQAAYHSANGAVLLLDGKFAEAVSELQEDPRDPLSLQLLADAQSKAGRAAESAKTLATLAAINDERVETAAVAQAVREALKRNNPASTQANTPQE